MNNLKKFLQTKIDYEENYTIKDVIDIIFKKILNWISQNYEIELIYDLHTFRVYFYNFIYSNYKPTKNDDLYEEYFYMKFSEDIINIYLECKEFEKSVNKTLLTSSFDLEEFLFLTLEIEDPYYDDINSDEENNLEDNIDESYL
jgi:hypothetical protein